MNQPQPAYLTDPPADPVGFLAALLMQRSHQEYETGIGCFSSPWSAQRCAEVAAAAFAGWDGSADLSAVQKDLEDLGVRLHWGADGTAVGGGGGPPRLYLESTDARPLDHGSRMVLLPPGGRPGTATHAALVAEVRELRERVIHWHREHGRMCREHQTLVKRLKQIADLAGES